MMLKQKFSCIFNIASVESKDNMLYPFSCYKMIILQTNWGVGEGVKHFI